MDAEHFLGFLILIGCVVIYFLPAIIGQKHRNSNSITVVNVFLGWTLVGWVIALAWALAKDR